MPERVGSLEGKQVLVMGLLDTKGFAWAIGEKARQEGAQVTYTVQNERFRDSLLRRSFKQEGLNLDDYRILPADVTNDEDIAGLFKQVEAPLDGLVYSIAYANPQTCLAESMFDAPRADIMKALEISAVGFALVAAAAKEKFVRGGSIVAMTFDSQNVYPHYNWMGVAKAALEAEARYIARDLGPLGVKVNCLSAGPQNTTAGTHIPGFASIAEHWSGRSPLGWDLDTDRAAVADSAVYLLSYQSRKVTGAVHHVDGGFNFVNIPIPPQA